LLVVVMFFKPECWSLCDTSVWDKININERINYYLWYSLLVKIIKKLILISPHCDRLLILVAICFVAMNFKCCVIVLSITTNNCLLHVPSIATNTNTLQSRYITSKTSSLH
jgi:hypothetical protein